MFRFAALLAVAMLALAGCSSAVAAPASTPASPNLPCSLPYGTEVELVSPAPGSAAEPGPIVLVASRPLPKTVSVVATDRRGVVTPVAALERIPKPAHSAPAAYPDPVYYRTVGNGLRSHRHYTLSLDDLAQNGCAPYAAMSGSARFST